MAEQLKGLVRQRASVKGQLTRLVNSMPNIEANDLPAWEYARDRLDKLFERWSDIQDQIVSLDEDETCVGNPAEVEAAHRTYYLEISQKIRMASAAAAPPELPGPSVSAPAPGPSVSQIATTSIVPQLQVPEFDGNPEDWLNFRDSFKNLVHDNPSIPNVQKFNFLRRALKGSVAESLGRISISSENYLGAWEQLHKKFDVPRKILNSHLRHLLDLPEMGEDSEAQLTALLEEADTRVSIVQGLHDGDTILQTIFAYIVVRKLNTHTRRAWERTLENSTIPKFRELIEFLRKRARGSDEVCIDRSKPNPSRSDKTKGYKTPKTQAYLATQTALHCAVCKGNHATASCATLTGVPPRERYSIVKRARLCINCLRPGHVAATCKSGDCRRCKQTHHTLLHFEEISSDTRGEQATPEPRVLAAFTNEEMLISTAVVNMIGPNNKLTPCRILIDTGAQAHVMTEAFLDKLGLQTTKREMRFAGISQEPAHSARVVEAIIKSRTSDFSMTRRFHVLEQLAITLPTRPIDRSALQFPSKITLADPGFCRPGPIDAILGGKGLFEILSVGQFWVPNTNLILQKTRLGWLVVGDVAVAQPPPVKHCFISRLEQQIERFWQLEDIDPTARDYPQHPAEESFVSTHSRDRDGRFVVALPCNQRVNQLGESRETALRRFKALERRFAGNPALADQYAQFMQEYEQLGHMTEIPSNGIDAGAYFIPHHAVFKISNGQSKIRVVFDASAKTGSGVSLNDTLIVGPTVQQDLFDIVARFRTFTYALTADIEKMYRQIRVHPDQVHLQTIFWRDEPSQPVKTFVMNTVTYGTACAPFLATRCLQQLAIDEGKRFPKAKGVLLRDFYMDDLLSGASTVDEAQQLKRQLVDICATGGFNLRQWASNEPTVVANSLESSPQELFLDSDQPRKTLGVIWQPKGDIFSYRINPPNNSTAYTKRRILSEIAQVFDPLGLVGPVIAAGKCLLQDLWSSGVNWDESLPLAIATEWRNWRERLTQLNNLNVSRRILLPLAEQCEIHGFCDASARAYGACLYVKSSYNDQTSVRLLCSRSRVAPLKTLSIPRLELSAALLVAQLYQRVAPVLSLAINRYYLWSDSTVVLHWVRKSPHLLNTFVANRVAKIQRLTDASCWRHVGTADNPADAISRGQDAGLLMQNDQWWYGPDWLMQDEGHWPREVLPDFALESLEERRLVVLPSIVNNTELWSRFSTWTRLLRVTAYGLRWRGIRRHPKGALSPEEIRASRNRIMRIIHLEEFAVDINQLKKQGSLLPNSKLLSLDPFIDQEDTLRVGGRLRRSHLHPHEKHPYLLPRGHPVTQLIIDYYHQTHWHAGINATLNAVRQRYWPIGGRSSVRRVIHKCIPCFRNRPSAFAPKMASLPESRVIATRPFVNTGLDYCGPFFIKEKKHRNRNKIKAYVAVFICFVTKAVHLELISDLSAEACLAGIKRFVGRRGLPEQIHSDNGSNFVGVKNEMTKLINTPQVQALIQEDLGTRGIKWKLSPPRAPHFGGLWEAAVKSFKSHLYKVVKDTLLTFEGLNTCLIQIEAILNSRPLTPLSSDPSDLTPLTPSHFLIGERLTSLPEENVTKLPDNRLSAWQHIQKLRQQFWSRWHREYLHELHTRGKWHLEDQRTISEGQLVLLREDGLPPMHWKLGRITRTFPGADGIVRVAEVRTVSGIFSRPVKKLCPLPIDN